MLARFRRDIFCDTDGESLTSGGLTMICQHVIDAERKGPGVAGQSAKHDLGLAHLRLAEVRCDRAQIGRELQRLDFERGLFGGGFFLSLEIAPDTDAVEAAIDAEGERTVAVFESADDEGRGVHA